MNQICCPKNNLHTITESLADFGFGCSAHLGNLNERQPGASVRVVCACLASSHLEELVQVLLQVLDEVGVGQFGQDEPADLLRERHLGLRQPRPVERVCTEETKTFCDTP